MLKDFIQAVESGHRCVASDCVVESCSLWQNESTFIYRRWFIKFIILYLES